MKNHNNWVFWKFF